MLYPMGPLETCMFGFVLYSLFGFPTYTCTHAFDGVRCCSSCVRCWQQTMMHLTLIVCRWDRCCLTSGLVVRLHFSVFLFCGMMFFFLTWQSPVVLNLCIAPCFDINVLRLFVWYICTYFVWMSNLFVQESVVCEDWYIFVVLCCVCFDTMATDQMLRWGHASLWHQRLCAFQDVFCVGGFCVL